MTAFLSSRYFHFIYVFFALSWIPYIVLRLQEQPWIYSLLYRENGIVENMTVVFYLLAAGFSGRLLYLARPRSRLLKALFLFSIFMLGEETRWGLIYLVEHPKQLSFTSFQDLIQMAFLNTPQNMLPLQNTLIVIARITGFILFVGGPVYIWIKRHKIFDNVPYKSSSLTPYLALYALFLLIAVFIEFFMPGGQKHKLLNVLEETLEMNASFVWFLISYISANLYQPHLIKRA